jgi:hypothetical protein
MASDEFYFHTGIKYSQAEKLKQHVHNIKNWDFTSFYRSDEGLEPFYHDPFLNKVHERFGGSLTAYKVPAKSFYPWHIDLNISGYWSLNMVFDQYNCDTMYSEGNDKIFIKTQLLTYVPNEWVIFNTQKPHCVNNLDSRDRIYVGYRARHTENYDYVVSWFKDNFVSTA